MGNRSEKVSSSGSTVAHEGSSKQHARSSRPAAEATAGEAIDLDGLSTAAGAAEQPLAPPTHGPAAEALYEGAECDVDMGNAVEAPMPAAEAGVRPPRPSNWESMSKNQNKTWRKHGGRPRRAQGHGGT